MTPRDLKRRISSVKNTRKVTHAMELIAATKMRRATQKASAIIPYTQSILRVLQNITQQSTLTPPALCVERSIKNILLVLITPNRGLCGPLVSRIRRLLTEELQVAGQKDISMKAVIIGKKGASITRMLGIETLAFFDKPAISPENDTLSPVVTLILNEFLAQKVDRVILYDTHYKNPLTQEARRRILLPFTIDSVKQQLQDILPNDVRKTENTVNYIPEVIIEPQPKDVLDALMSLATKALLYDALLSSYASEQAARMVAMKNATESAGDVIKTLTGVYNTARQAKITQEVAEINAGVIAV